MLNMTKLLLTRPNGEMFIKPWVSELDDKGHLKDAKEAYSEAINDGCKLTLYT